MPQNGCMAARAGGGTPYIGDPRDMLGTSEYGRLDRLGAVIGPARTFSVVYPQLQDVDFTAQATELHVPVYLVQGRHDLAQTATPTLPAEGPARSVTLDCGCRDVGPHSLKA